MTNQCPIEEPKHDFVDCNDDCVTRFFEHHENYFDEETSFFCTIVRKFRWDTCDLGIGIGRHVFSITLLPGEEVELEEVRRDKFSRTLHDQRTLATELELTVEETLREETSNKDEYFFEHIGENNFKLFGQKRKGQRTLRNAWERIDKTLKQTVTKSAAQVAAKNETTIEVKAEAENVYRSTRKVKNPNPCQPVTYNFYQIAKRMQRRLTLVEVVLSCEPPAGIAVPRTGVTTFRTPVSRPQRVNLNIVAPPPAWQLDTKSIDINRSPCIMSDETEARFEIAQPTKFERSRDELIEELRTEVGEEAAHRAEQALDPINDLVDPNGGGLIFEEEICIGTTGFHVEGMVSPCAVCEDTDLKKKELEIEKCHLELEMLKCEIEKCKLSLVPPNSNDYPKTIQNDTPMGSD